MGSTSNGAQFVKESGQPEIDFEDLDDCRRFQELVLGEGIDLVAPQFPIEGIMTIRSKVGKKESKLQCLRLWQRGLHQYIMYYANLASGSYKEYPTRWLRERPVKSKRSVQLEVQEPSPPKQRESEPRGPFMNTARQNPSTTASEAGLTRPIEFEDLKSLGLLIIDFSKEEDKKRFLQHAVFG